MTASKGARAWMPAGAVIAAAGLLAHALSYLPFLADDALISLRYSHRLLQGQGLTWTDGERVEGYSNLLWILLTSAAGALGMDLILAARTLGVVLSLLALAVVARAAGSLWRDAPWPAAFPALALAATGTVAVWAIGGLEQPLVLALLAWAIVTLYPQLEERADWKQAAAPAVLFGLLCWTRPDGPLFAAAAGMGLLLARGRSRWRAVALLAAVCAFFVGAQLGFRLLYYGEFLPNTAHVKLMSGSDHWRTGLRYVVLGQVMLFGLGIPAVLGLIAALRGGRQPLAVDRSQRHDLAGDSARHHDLAFDRTGQHPIASGHAHAPAVPRDDPRGRVLLILPGLAAWLLYVVSIGGDIFPAWRHFGPVAVLEGLLAVEGMRWLARRPLVPLLVATLAAFAVAQWLDPQNRRARSERWEWDGQVVGYTLGEAFRGQSPLLAVDPAGCVPYFSGLPCLDMLGLNDKHIARSRPPESLRGRLAHEMGDGAYVLDRNPDLVLFSQPAGGPPDYPSGKMMVADPRFGQRYREILVEGRDPKTFRFRIQVRREGGVTGIQRDSAQVRVPGYLVADGAEAISHLASGRLAACISQDRPALLTNLDLPAGAWILRAELDAGAAACECRVAAPSSRSGQRVWSGRAPLAFMLDGDMQGIHQIDVQIQPIEPGETHLASLSFSRLP